GVCEAVRPDPYVPIPTTCRGAKCASGIFPEYTFSSSDPEVADFVSPDPRSPNPHNVLLVKEKPVLDSHSGLLCAFNAGTTTVTVPTGGPASPRKVPVPGATGQRPGGPPPVKSRAAQLAEPVLPPDPAPGPEFDPGPPPPPPPVPVLSSSPS